MGTVSFSVTIDAELIPEIEKRIKQNHNGNRSAYFNEIIGKDIKVYDHLTKEELARKGQEFNREASVINLLLSEKEAEEMQKKQAQAEADALLTAKQAEREVIDAEKERVKAWWLALPEERASAIMKELNAALPPYHSTPEAREKGLLAIQRREMQNWEALEVK